MAPQSSLSSKVRNLDWFRKVPRCAADTRARPAGGATAAHCSADAPRCVALRLRDLSEATLPGSIISMIAMVSMVVLFFLVRARACVLQPFWRQR